MHNSRLAGFSIDCQTEQLDEATRFWSAALGLAAQPPGANPRYRVLETPADEVHVEVQQVSHASRVHLDIESDDIEAEVRRLERLGAQRIGMVQDWYVMQAPTGQRFCVVKPQRADFAARAKRWEE